MTFRFPLLARAALLGAALTGTALAAGPALGAAKDSGPPPACAPFAGQKCMGATKVFRYLDKYLGTPPEHRNHLKVTFYLKIGDRPAAGRHVTLVDGDERIPLPLGADGHFERLPTLEQLEHKPVIVVDAPADTVFRNVISIESNVRPAAEIDAAEVRASIAQVSTVVKDTVGVVALLMAPTVHATFPGAGSGTAVTASGAVTPLPLENGAPAYDPGVIKGAVKLRFAKTPSKVDLLPAK